MESVKYWLWLSMRPGIGFAKVKKLLNIFGSADEVYKASERDYFDIETINRENIKSLSDKDLKNVNKILTDCDEAGCRIISFQDCEYPERLKNIYDPPLILYIKGKMPDVDHEPVVGAVGTRKCTPYGIINAESTGYKLSKSGIIVVTGLAKGVDTAATEGALRGGTAVIGVIGSGLDIIYPAENKQLFTDVIDNGAVISEYPPGTRALHHHFPARNRIISGLSLGIAVIEAPKKSGALITAARALEQGRDVFVLPGNVDAAACEGSNRLLREGAIPFMSGDDIIDEYIELYPDKIKTPETDETKKPFDNNSKVDYIGLGNFFGKLAGDEMIIAKSIGTESLCIDEIIIETMLPAQKVSAVLTMLEISGYVRRDDSGRWKATSGGFY